MDELLSLLSATECTTEKKLCQALGMTRAAIWKRVETLQREGYQIEAAGKRGYCLPPKPDSLLPAYIAGELSTRWVGQGNIIYEHTVSSTNALLKELTRAGAPKGSLVLCERQTQGRGRLQRSWDAAEGENLLHSLLICPSLPMEQAQLCTLAAAVAMAEAIEETSPGLRAGIKWPNDIVIGGRKCVGILSELVADADGLPSIVMGVGVNVNQRVFPDDLRHKATSLLLERLAAEGEAHLPVELLIDRRRLLVAYLSRMEEAIGMLETGGLPALLPEYTRRSVTLGARVRVIGAGRKQAQVPEQVQALGRAQVPGQAQAPGQTQDLPLWSLDPQGCAIGAEREPTQERGHAQAPGQTQGLPLRSLDPQSRATGTGADFTGIAEAVDETGALLVRDASGNLRRVLSGDVSVRGVMGYVETQV